MKASSGTTTPDRSPASGSRFMASRMRWVMNHAVLGVSPYLRSISRPASPFLLAHISKRMNTQISRETFVPCMTVPVMTENCLRHP